MTKIKYTFLLAVFVFISCSQLDTSSVIDRSIASVNTDCVQSALEIIRQAKSETRVIGKVRYPKGLHGQSGKQIQFGFESEYIESEAVNLLNQYSPTLDIYPEGANSWIALPHDKKVDFIKVNAKQIFPYRAMGKLQLIATDPELKKVLPESLVYDNEKFEIVLPPMETVEDLFGKMEIINAKIGIGSMQAMVSTPFRAVDSTIINAEHFYRETLGYYNFMNDFDTLTKMFSGSELYDRNKGAQVLKNFNHPWLGPMTRIKHEKLKKYLAKIAEGQDLNEDELKDISFQVRSHKFIGGLSFRPDVAYKDGRIASEVRDCHQNVKCIKEKVLREIKFLEEGRERFANYSALIPFDSIDAFEERLPAQNHEFFKRLFPKYRKSVSAVELDLFRNFSYPLRDWSKHIEALGDEELRASVKKAKTSYLAKIEATIKSLKAKVISEDEARAQVMGAVAEFSKESGLYFAMKKVFDEMN